MGEHPYPIDEGQTHYQGCWRTRGHHNCAVSEVERLTAEIEKYKGFESFVFGLGKAAKAASGGDHG